jgi:4'-phosphopantetheinyl transferase EntD
VQAPPPLRRVPEIETLFGAPVTAYELHGGGEEAWLLPEEAAAIASAAPARRAEFAAGRLCARAGLAALGLEAAPVLRAGRAPQWPAGYVGAISHTTGYALAVVARKAAAVGVGVDVEAVGRVGRHLYPKLFTDGERAALLALAPDVEARRATAWFGAKEAFYKAQFPQTGAWVGFADVAVSDADPGRLLLRPASELAALRGWHWPVEGGWVVRDERLVVAGVTARVAPE